VTSALDTVGILIEARILRLLADLPPTFPDGLQSFTIAARDVVAVVTFRPQGMPAIVTASNGHQLSPAELATYGVAKSEITSRGRPCTGSEIRAAMTAAGCKWGASTIHRSLADLTAFGLLVNTRNKEGYKLPEGVQHEQAP